MSDDKQGFTWRHYDWSDWNGSTYTTATSTSTVPWGGSYEAVGGKPIDLSCQEELSELHLQLCLAAMCRRVKGEAMSRAVSAVQSQRRTDGRPAFFIPDLGD